MKGREEGKLFRIQSRHTPKKEEMRIDFFLHNLQIASRVSSIDDPHDSVLEINTVMNCE